MTKTMMLHNVSFSFTSKIFITSENCLVDFEWSKNSCLPGMIWMLNDIPTYEITSVFILTILEMKLSLMMICRIVFQSMSLVPPSPSNKQMASKANFTAGGGLAIDRISTRSFFLMPFTADSETSRSGTI